MAASDPDRLGEPGLGAQGHVNAAAARGWRRIVSDPRWPLVQLAGLYLAWGAWFLRPSWGWVLWLAAVPSGVRWLADRHKSLPSGVAAAVLLFMLTGLLGVYAAYDRDGALAVFPAPAGWQKLWGLVLAMLFLATLASLREARARRWAVGSLTAVGAAVAVWFMLTNNWMADPAEWGVITRLGRLLQASLPFLPGHRLNANVAAGMLVPLFPLALGLSVEDWQARRGWWLWGALTAALMALGLLMTTSRGAMAATAAGIGLAALWWLTGRFSYGAGRWWLMAAALLLGSALLLAVALGVPALRDPILNSGSLANRWAIYTQAFWLVRDYPFTGSGLGNFALVHSTYSLLIHVPILAHAHALLADVAVEQGWFGAISLMALYGSAAWLGMRALALPEGRDPLLGAGLMACAALLIHGLIDDPLYGSRGIVLLGVPVGVIAAALPAEWARFRWRAARPVTTVVLILLLILVLALGWRPLASSGWANAGALAQTRTELPRYDYQHFGELTLDQLRQQVDLSAAQAYFQRALALRPHATAATRLSQIAFGRKDYQAALGYAQSAWQAGYRDRVTALVWGDAQVAVGQIEAAAALVGELKWAEERFLGQAWYKYWIHGDDVRAIYAWQAAKLVNPDQTHADYWIQQAEKRAAQP